MSAQNDKIKLVGYIEPFNLKIALVFPIDGLICILN